ncbi:MAG TPA: hypothetical protein EYQ47_01505 [Cycloclasticus sp.]|jgi:hypothetical protein|nr:hypothetical protein [Cycloclasticus sp.]HIL93222.1 hypothetical protein [Cycloclasticus sp.]
MNRIRHIIAQSMLVLSLMVLPWQSLLALDEISACDMDMSLHEMNRTDMMNCHSAMNGHTADGTMLETSCADDHCNKCFHASPFVMTDSTVIAKHVGPQVTTYLLTQYLSILEPIESPPPRTA